MFLSHETPIKISIPRLKSWEFMQNAEFTNLTQKANFYIQYLFQTMFITSIQPQITKERIKAKQRMNYLVFLSF